MPEDAIKELERVLTGYLEQEGPLKTALAVAKGMRERGHKVEIIWNANGGFTIKIVGE